MQSGNEIIVAPATLSGGAIAIVRVSGDGSIELIDRLFRPKSGKSLLLAKGHTLHYGEIMDGERIIDDVLISLFRAPHSYTSEDSIEISCHGSDYIVQQIISLIINHGARMADHGEFTIRAYLAGRMDLSQAESVADMIASTSGAQHTLASTQMRGGYSQRFTELRAQLLKLAALLELELDFSEEEVEFADRTALKSLISEIDSEVQKLRNSFSLGNAIKQGVAVAIVGNPNVGKSTLLNQLLGDDRAMVSEVAGTTRDSIEEQLHINGITFRFIDTAGIHKTDDKLELMGIERTQQAIERAQIIIHLIDSSSIDSYSNLEISNNQQYIKVINKIDKLSSIEREALAAAHDGILISARENIGIDSLVTALCARVDTTQLYNGSTIVSNARHYECLNLASRALQSATDGMSNNLPTDLLCQDIREVLHHIGSITGEITTHDILSEIFSKFCIGK